MTPSRKILKSFNLNNSLLFIGSSPPARALPVFFSRLLIRWSGKRPRIGLGCNLSIWRKIAETQPLTFQKDHDWIAGLRTLSPGKAKGCTSVNPLSSFACTVALFIAPGAIRPEPGIRITDRNPWITWILRNWRMKLLSCPEIVVITGGELRDSRLAGFGLSIA